MLQWHNAKNDLPQTTGSYIVLTDNFDVCIAHYYVPTKYHKRCGFTGVPGQQVTHWIELPDLPEED